MVEGMSNSSNLPRVTEFSLAFAAALREVMKRRGVSQTKVAETIHRDQTYVSDRVGRTIKRAVDTDVIAGVAEVAEVQPSIIVREVLAEMKRAATASRSPKVVGEAPRGRAKRDRPA